MGLESSGRCSLGFREAGLAAAGSAASFTTLLLVEVPLPWPDKIEAHPVMQQVSASLAAAGVSRDGLRLGGLARVQPGVQPGVTGTATIVCATSTNDDGWQLPFAVRSLAVPAGEVVGAAVALATGAPEARRATSPEALLAVCAHGRRDVCCGTDGTRLSAALAAQGHPVWRTSHLGGHRYAPTALVLPSGRSWAYLDEVGHPDGAMSDPDLIRRHCRGWAALGNGWLQAAEVEVLARVGPDLDGLARRVQEVERLDDDRRLVTVEHTDVYGPALQHTVEVRRVRSVPVPPCRGGQAKGELSPEFAASLLSSVVGPT